jgi:hypothetical protein
MASFARRGQKSDGRKRLLRAGRAIPNAKLSDREASTAATNLRAEGLRENVHSTSPIAIVSDATAVSRGRRQARPRASDFLASLRSGPLCYDEL